MGSLSSSLPLTRYVRTRPYSKLLPCIAATQGATIQSNQNGFPVKKATLNPSIERLASLITCLTISAHAADTRFVLSELLASSNAKKLLDTDMKLNYGTQPMREFIEISCLDVTGFNYKRLRQARNSEPNAVHAKR
jgi:hypothetical protein